MLRCDSGRSRWLQEERFQYTHIQAVDNAVDIEVGIRTGS